MAKQKLAWKPWHEVVKIRDDLKSGDLPMHLFAADLYEVMMQNGKRPIYENANDFFALTYPTHNLRGLVRDVVLRLAGKNDKAVRQLELNYGGGKTHTLITMRHLVSDPANLPDVAAVDEFVQDIGLTPPKTRVAALCFDKIDLEKGCEVRGPDGTTRTLREPWSLLAYQLAGDEGLKLLHGEGKAEERSTPPAENVLADLLSVPLKDGEGTLLLLDEVLLYAKVRVKAEPGWLETLNAFFQYLTQAASKVERCCVVASLLSSEPKDQADTMGKNIVSAMNDIFQRQREEAVQPVEKDDVAEVLRRRLFDAESIRHKGQWPTHVIAALKGIGALDDQTAKTGSASEDRYLKSFPFHPELTEVFYAKWASGIERFQKTRGVLRTFAIALRQAVKWDQSPLVGPAVFLNDPKSEGLSEAARELVSIADTIVSDGAATRWTGILETELACGRAVENDSVGLKHREIEQAVMATFLHSQPSGRTAKTRDLMLLCGPCRPDKIEFEKGLFRWAQGSSWLDDKYLPERENELPGEWMLGNRPNLNQMQSAAAVDIEDSVVEAKLFDDIGKLKTLTSGASAAGVKVHTLPQKPKDIEDDGMFHYAVLGPKAASESGKPSAEAKRFLDETTGSNKPRVNRNAVILLVPSRDGLAAAEARVRDAMAWETVRSDLTPSSDEEKETIGAVDVARMQTLKVNIDKANKRVPEAIRQAYCIVVTVSEKDDAQAFKLSIEDQPHFETLKNDARSRVRDSPITADALLPDGPYELWKDDDESRRVRDLAGAFAQLPHLPKMLKSQTIVDTLVEGCLHGSFVLKVTRPDRTFRTWWRSRPDESALSDPTLELVLSEKAELNSIAGELLGPDKLPELWSGDEIEVSEVAAYFDGSRTIDIDRGDYTESVAVPKAPETAVIDSVKEAVEAGHVWLLSGPASFWKQEIPDGIISTSAKLRGEPETISAATLLPANLTNAWKDDRTNAMSLTTALSQEAGVNLPWRVVETAIDSALSGNFFKLADDSADWPCDYAAAKNVVFEVAADVSGGKGGTYPPKDKGTAAVAEKHGPRAAADLESFEIQDLAEALPKLLEIKNKCDAPMNFRVQIDFGDAEHQPDPSLIDEVNEILKEISDKMKMM